MNSLLFIKEIQYVKVFFTEALKTRFTTGASEILLARFNGKAHIAGRKAKHTLSTFYELYVSLKSDLLRYKTMELHNSAQRHFLTAEGDKLLSQYTHEDVDDSKTTAGRSRKLQLL